MNEAGWKKRSTARPNDRSSGCEKNRQGFRLNMYVNEADFPMMDMREDNRLTTG